MYFASKICEVCEKKFIPKFCSEQVICFDINCMLRKKTKKIDQKEMVRIIKIKLIDKGYDIVDINKLEKKLSAQTFAYTDITVLEKQLEKDKELSFNHLMETVFNDLH